MTHSLHAALVVGIAGSLIGCGAHGWLDGPPDGGAAARDGGLRSDAGVDRGIDASSPMPDAGPPDAGSGSDIGEPCGAPSDCDSADALAGRGLPACLMAGTWTNGAAWTDGYCTDYCVPPPPPAHGAPLPQEDCPDGSSCVPVGDAVGICLRGCETDDDCRTEDGYFCRREFGGFEETVTTEGGVCMASHCQTRGCPGLALCSC